MQNQTSTPVLSENADKTRYSASFFAKGLAQSYGKTHREVLEDILALANIQEPFTYKDFAGTPFKPLGRPGDFSTISELLDDEWKRRIIDISMSLEGFKLLTALYPRDEEKEQELIEDFHRLQEKIDLRHAMRDLLDSFGDACRINRKYGAPSLACELIQHVIDFAYANAEWKKPESRERMEAAKSEIEKTMSRAIWSTLPDEERFT
jgi:hypothetical protein